MWGKSLTFSLKSMIISVCFPFLPRKYSLLYRNTTQRHARSMEHAVTMKQEVDDIKKVFMNIVIVKGKTPTNLLESCLDRTVTCSSQMSLCKFQRGLNRVDSPIMNAINISCLSVKPLRPLYLRLPTF